MNVFLGAGVDSWGWRTMMVSSLVSGGGLAAGVLLVGGRMSGMAGGEDTPKTEYSAVSVEGGEGEGVELGEVGISETPSSNSPPTQTPSLFGPMCTIVKSALSTPYSITFLLACLVLSMGMSLVENLSFVFFSEHLHASSTLDGFTVVVTVLFEVPIFYFAPAMLEKFGPPCSKGSPWLPTLPES